VIADRCLVSDFPRPRVSFRTAIARTARAPIVLDDDA
jgi:hypothetical protein